MTASAARRLARDAVTRVRERASFAHETLDSLLERAKLEERDAAFASRLALGTIAYRGVLDAAVARHLRPDVSLEPAVSDALAVSAYELLQMRTPARAAVNEGVELVRTVRPAAAGLANAVLRRLAAEAPDFPWGDPDTDEEALARQEGHPLWLCRLWIAECGRERAALMMQADNEPAPLYVAVEPHDEVTVGALEKSGARPLPGPFPGCLVLADPRSAVRSGLLGATRLLVADAGAQLAAQSVPLAAGSHVVEIGAGRGTKTLIMALAARTAGLDCDFLAIDIHDFKLEALRRTAARLGLDGVSTRVADATDPDAPGMPARGSVDAVLVDAPCSGLGTLRRHPDRRWRATADEIPALSDLGYRLLESASSLVRPGGFVVYSTCTVSRTENDEVIDRFLRSTAGAGFQISPLSRTDVGELGVFVTDEGRFQSWPQQDGPDGHFITRLVRRS